MLEEDNEKELLDWNRKMAGQGYGTIGDTSKFKWQKNSNPTFHPWVEVGTIGGDKTTTDQAKDVYKDAIQSLRTQGDKNSYRLLVFDSKTGNWNLVMESLYTATAIVPGKTPPTSSGCFVATAAYGTPMDPRIDALRKFRDDKLETDPIGKVLVKTYYTVSPPIARGIAKSTKMRAVVRRILKPIVDHLNN